MGLEESRNMPLPDEVDQFENDFKQHWPNVVSRNHNNSSQMDPRSTLRDRIIHHVGNLLESTFQTNNIPSTIGILEIMAGNGIASTILANRLATQYGTWIATDINDYPKPLEPLKDSAIEFHIMDAIDAVTQFGQQSQLLLMISPPPAQYNDSINMKFNPENNGYGDYFACKKFINQTVNEVKYIVFVGELGASDGSEGMYRYLMEHPRLEGIQQIMLYEGSDPFGGPVEKEFFMFQIN